jgi:hypothetical protein
VAASCGHCRVLWNCAKRGGGILGLADNLLASQGLCSMEIFCFVRCTVAMNFMFFMNITVLKLRRPHYEMISSKLPKSSSIVLMSLYCQYISRSVLLLSVYIQKCPCTVSIYPEVSLYCEYISRSVLVLSVYIQKCPCTVSIYPEVSHTFTVPLALSLLFDVS